MSQLLTLYTTPVIDLDRFSLWRDRECGARNMPDAPLLPENDGRRR